MSTSHKSNFPEAYDIVPNRLELDQLVLRAERVPDTVQTDHTDWGFRTTGFYGLDYRYTTSQGWLSNQLLRSNNLYGFDPIEIYGLAYFPNVAAGMEVKVGRYISPPDIEAQLAPDNYNFTHSLTFASDPFTQTGVEVALKIDDDWSILLGLHAGNDIAPWDPGAHPTLEAFVRWVSPNNNDSILAGANSLSLTNGNFSNGHDNLQMFVATWTHRFSPEVHTIFEAYYEYQYNAYVGGTFNYGPVRDFGGGGGPGAFIPGRSYCAAVLNNFQIKLTDSDYLTLRNEFLSDPQGQRNGYATSYNEHAIGISHAFSPLATIRPELRYDHAWNATPFDDGTKRNQFMFAVDGLIRF